MKAWTGLACTTGSFKIKVRPAARYLQASLKPPGCKKVFRFEDSSRFFRLPQQAAQICSPTKTVSFVGIWACTR
jgi:hypothetical protein